MKRARIVTLALVAALAMAGAVIHARFTHDLALAAERARHGSGGHLWVGHDTELRSEIVQWIQRLSAR